MREDLLARLRDGGEIGFSQQLRLVGRLSLPAIMAQLSMAMMHYIDSSMVGQLGASQSASIGLMMTSTWLFSDMCFAAVAGFTVLVAQYIGAKQERTARNIMKQGMVITIGLSVLLAALGAAISGWLPGWLGGEPSICRDATRYFMIFALSLPFAQLNNIAGGMLQASGNMKAPSILNIVMCVMDVVFNAFFIFPEFKVLGITLPGAGLGVAGAALGTSAAQAVTSLVMASILFLHSPALKLRRGEPLRFCRDHIIGSMKISVPVAVEYAVMCSAQIVVTRIVAPLGTIPIAANSFAVAAESLCYMPGYGIGMAASTLIGQSVGAKRADMVKRLSWLTTLLGMTVMAVSGTIMYAAAPWIMGMLSRDAQVVALGVKVLRIEAFAEPLFGAAIVASGVCRGAGDTLGPSLMSFCSMWLVRIPVAALLVGRIGLSGVWVAMCSELCVRGALFLIRLWRGKYAEKALKAPR